MHRSTHNRLLDQAESDQAEHDLNPKIPDFFTALYFGLTTLTTVGFGGINPPPPLTHKTKVDSMLKTSNPAGQTYTLADGGRIQQISLSAPARSTVQRVSVIHRKQICQYFFKMLSISISFTFYSR